MTLEFEAGTTIKNVVLHVVKLFRKNSSLISMHVKTDMFILLEDQLQIRPHP